MQFFDRTRLRVRRAISEAAQYGVKLDPRSVIARIIGFEEGRVDTAAILHTAICLYSERGWKRDLVKQLESRQVNVVFDVGANSGQYAIGLRKAGYKGRIISFEPLSRPFTLLEKKASKDPLWDCRRCAIGDFDGTTSINVAGNAGLSSSVLPMLKSHQDAFPPANYVGTETVPIYRLDSVAAEFLSAADVTFLKFDVQGFERQALAGSKSTVSDRCAGMQLELSFAPLYEDSMLVREALDLAYSLGFTLTNLMPCFIDIHNGRILQADGIFFCHDDLSRIGVDPLPDQTQT